MKKFYFIIAFIAIPILFQSLHINGSGIYHEEYVCSPCGNDCDHTIYNNPGTCPHCHMPLVKSSSVKFKHIEASSICKYLKDHPDALLIDVRTKEEFEGKSDPDYGTLKNAINIPVQNMEGKINELKKFKANEIIVYCSHGHRSEQASYILTQNGFLHVTNMNGGMSVMNNKECKK